MPNATSVSPEFLDVRAAARFLSVSPSWLRRSDCRRIRLGGRVVYYVEHLRQFALSRCTHEVKEEVKEFTWVNPNVTGAPMSAELPIYGLLSRTLPR